MSRSKRRQPKYCPIEHARGILGEHMRCYLIICMHEDAPNTVQIRTDNKYAALGLVEHVAEILKENTVDDGWEIVLTDEEEDEEDDGT